MRDLLVASGGGHLQQLLWLESRLRDPAQHALWVTYDLPQTQSLLQEQAVVHAHHPTTKNLVNAVRNYRLARRVLSEHHVDRVVSTGAAVAVPFMLAAARRGIPCHYIESAARVTGPSLSGRMLERVNGVRLYRQMGSWRKARWRQGPNVFDGFTSHTAVKGEVRRVVASLGTHSFPFPLFVERLAAVLAERDVDVLWQLGSTPAPENLPGRVVTTLPADELEDAIAVSDVVIGHAGVGLALTALSQGRVPVLVPRRRGRGEHTDDHQTQIADELGHRALAISTSVEGLDFDDLVEAARRRVTLADAEPFPLTE